MSVDVSRSNIQDTYVSWQTVILIKYCNLSELYPYCKTIIQKVCWCRYHNMPILFITALFLSSDSALGMRTREKETSATKKQVSFYRCLQWDNDCGLTLSYFILDRINNICSHYIMIDSHLHLWYLMKEALGQWLPMKTYFQRNVSFLK